MASRDAGHDEPAFLHPTAVVDDGAVVGAGAKVWHFAHVCAGAHVGAASVLGQGVYVGPGVVIGRGCKVQNQVSVYEGVVLADEVFVGPSAVFTNVLRPRAHVSRRDEFLATRVGRRATIGANATILCGVTIGERAFVGAGAVVIRDVAPGRLVLGAPARPVGWVCACGERLADEGAVKRCTRCGASWQQAAHGGIEESPA